MYQNSFEYTGRADSSDIAAQASAEASAYATFGLLRSSSIVVATTEGNPAGWNAGGVVNNTVSFSDTLNVTSASRAGQSGVVVGKLLVDGMLGSDSSGWGARSSASVSVGAGFGTYGQSLFSVNGTPSSSGSGVPGVVTFNIPIVFSPTFVQPFSVSLYTAATASALYTSAGPLSAQGLSDYASTLAWGGVVDVLDASGRSVGDWSMRSGSGFNYAYSFASQVPEPGTWALMAAGALVLVGWQRRRALPGGSPR